MNEGDGDERQQRVWRKRKQIRSDFRAVFGSPAGKSVMRELYKQSVEANVGYMQRESALHMQGRQWMYALICKNQRITDDEIVRLTIEEQGI